MKEAEMRKIGDWINEVLTHAKEEAVLDRIAGEVAELCSSFPCPGINPQNWAEDGGLPSPSTRKEAAMAR